MRELLLLFFRGLQPYQQDWTDRYPEEAKQGHPVHREIRYAGNPAEQSRVFRKPWFAPFAEPWLRSVAFKDLYENRFHKWFGSGKRSPTDSNPVVPFGSGCSQINFLLEIPA